MHRCSGGGAMMALPSPLFPVAVATFVALSSSYKPHDAERQNVAMQKTEHRDAKDSVATRKTECRDMEDRALQR